MLMYDRGRVAKQCAEIERCNQRGGRMLSILDLLDAGTLPLEVAGYLMGEVSQGASFMVGAVPGGGGKTTVMGALLNLLPVELDLIAATNKAVQNAKRNDQPPACYICHEISPGPYFCYLWGQDLRDYGALCLKGHTLATNLHADDANEARDQVCGDNGVPEAHFNAFRLLVFLRLKQSGGRIQRLVQKVYASDGVNRHRLVYSRRKGLDAHAASDPAWTARCQAFLEDHLATNLRTIQEVRERVAAFLRG